MALKTYEIEWDDGTVQYLQLSDDDHKAWKDRADDKKSPVKSVKQGSPEPFNKK